MANGGKFNAYSTMNGQGSKRYERARASSQLTMNEMQNTNNIVIELTQGGKKNQRIGV